MNFKQKFREEFEKLNPAQREAAEAIEGPVLVVAGPGTGKTQTLALRLANILIKTQARPHNLLALTFTESAAIELKKRLAEIIGPDAYGITASTFHAFCARLHGLFPAEFATTRERVQIDELRQQQIFKEILEQGDFPLLRPLRAPELYLRDLSKAISDLKREGINSEQLREIVQAEQETLSQEERINPRTKKPFGKILQAEKRIVKNLELADFYKLYQEKLEAEGFTDYDDLILSVIEKLAPVKFEKLGRGIPPIPPSPPLSKGGTSPRADDNFLLAYLQENYLYVTVDEFQDTNGAQNAILKAWASYDSKPNLCVVGDDDQSIYRFQGASLLNILEFREHYPETKIVTLTRNYRSTQTILDSARSVIEKNSERLANKITDLSKELTAENFPKLKNPIRVAESASETDEVGFITTEIQKLLARKVAPSEIAVIYRNRFHGDIFADALRRAGVPVHRTDGQNALLNSRVKQLLALLHSINNPADSIALMAVLFADFIDLQPVEVYRLAKKADRENNLLDVMLLEDSAEAVRNLGNKLLAWQKAKIEMNLFEFVENVAAESGLTKIIANKKDYESAEALAAFLTFARNFSISNEAPDLGKFLEDLDAMVSQGIALPLPARPTEAVTLTTAHRAKGLEWAHVFIIRAEDNSWGGKPRRQMLKLPESILVEANTVHDATEQDKEKNIEDERRLFYVAMTRAKESLTISVAGNYDFREMTPSRFIAELDSDLSEKFSVPADPLSALPLDSAPELDPESRKFLTSLLAEFRLSPTALNNYLCCPKRFLLENLLRLPTLVDPDERAGAIFGLAVHAGLEEFSREFKLTGKLPKNETAFTALRKALKKEPLTERQYSRIEKDAVIALEKYLEFHSSRFQPPVEVEYGFGRHDIHLNDIALTGKVDRIDFVPQTKDEVIFIDYKSQKPYSRAAIQGETANSTGDAYRQLLFYLLLAELDSRFIFKPREAVLSFVRQNDAGEFKDESFVPERGEIEDLKKTIRKVWRRISDLDFGCISGEEDADCRRCRYKDICAG